MRERSTSSPWQVAFIRSGGECGVTDREACWHVGKILLLNERFRSPFSCATSTHGRMSCCLEGSRGKGSHAWKRALSQLH